MKFLTIFLLFVNFYFVLNGKRNGSLVSLDDYLFSAHNQFYSKYFMNFNETLELKLASIITKNFEFYNKMYIRTQPNDNVTINNEDSIEDSYLSNIEIIKEENEDKNSSIVLSPGIDYFVDYHSDTPIITDLNLDYAPYLRNFNSTYDVRCSSQLKGIDFETLKATHKSWEIRKIDVFSKEFSFALIKEKDSSEYKLRKIKFSDEKSKEGNLELSDFEFIPNESIADMKTINNFWILKPNNNLFNKKLNYTDLPSLAVSTNQNIYLFKCKDDEIVLYSKINYKQQIPGGVTLEDFNITKIGLWNDLIVIGTYENGLNFFNIEKENNNNTLIQYKFLRAQSNFYGKLDKMLYNFRIKDFIINSETIYCLVEKFGLKIYSMKSEKLLNFEFYHPYLISFDHSYSINNLKTDPYRGILIDNSQQEVPEFLMELNIKNEEIPLINKLYSYSRALDVVNMVYDNKYSYLFDNLSRTLFMIKRSQSPLSPSLIYKIDLSKNFLNEEKKYQVVDLSNGKRLLFLDIDKAYVDENVLLSDITQRGTTVNCNFDDPGVYILKYSYAGMSKILVHGENEGNTLNDANDVRDQPLSDDDVLNYIHTDIIRVEVENKNIFIWAIIGIVIGIFVIFVILIFIYQHKKKKDNVHKKQEFAERMPYPYTQTEADNNKNPIRSNEEMIIEVEDHFESKNN